MNSKHKRYLGIDFGTKRIGVAVSDPEGRLAFPHIVIDGGKSNRVDLIADICRDNDVGTIVIGESKNYSGRDNAIMPQVRTFAKELEEKTGVPVIFHPEFMTSMQAAHIQGEGSMFDASAAAIILQSYMDLNKNMQEQDRDKVENKMLVPAPAPAPVSAPALAPVSAAMSAPIETPKISYEDFAKVELKVGRILSAEPIPKSDKLLKLSVDFAEGITAEAPTGVPRQILSGIAKFFPDPSKLVGRKCMFVTNLAPRKMMGMESNGMILTVSVDGVVGTEGVVGADAGAGEFSLLELHGVNGGEIPVGTKAK